MSTSRHQAFLSNFAGADEHYSYEDAPVAYIQNSANLTPEMLKAGAEHPLASVQLAAMSHPNATPEMLLGGVGNREFNVRVAAATHPNATPEVIDKAMAGIGTEKNYDFRHHIVGDRRASPTLLAKAMEDDTNPSIRISAAIHSNATPEILDKAVSDPIWMVRHAAVSNWNSTPEILEKARRDHNPYVRQAVMHHPNATADMILDGLKDYNEDVRDAAHYKAKKMKLL